MLLRELQRVRVPDLFAVQGVPEHRWPTALSNVSTGTLAVIRDEGARAVLMQCCLVQVGQPQQPHYVASERGSGSGWASSAVEAGA